MSNDTTISVLGYIVTYERLLFTIMLNCKLQGQFLKMRIWERNREKSGIFHTQHEMSPLKLDKQSECTIFVPWKIIVIYFNFYHVYYTVSCERYFLSTLYYCVDNVLSY